MNPDALEDLLAEFVERRERGEPVTADGFAAEHPDSRDALLPALEALERTAALLPAGDLPPFLGPYRIEGRLGSGGTGEVFAARDRDGRPVAIKCLLPHMRLQPRAIERLRREGDVLQTIDHAGVVRIEAIGEGDGMLFLVMERIDGRSLAEVLHEARQRRAAGESGPAAELLALSGPPDSTGELRAVALVATLAHALAATHRHGLLHRDLKPSNVLLRSSGQPVLVDFGLALDPEADTLTNTGDVLGTPNYMSPEQALGRVATEQSDVYGLAAILYELVTLVPPHQGPDALQVLSAVRDAPPKPARSVEPAVSSDLERVLRRALAHRATDRWHDAEQFAAALEALLAGARPARTTISLHQRIEEFWLRHRRSMLAAVATITVLGLVAALWRGQQATLRARSGEVLTSACTAFLDDSKDGRVEAARLLQEVAAEPRLSQWLIDDATGDDPLLVALQRGLAERRKDPAAAVTAFTAAVRVRPDLPLAGALLGLAAADAKNYELAERELVAACRSLPRCHKVRSELADVRRRRKDHIGATAMWREVTELRPDHALSFAELARSLSQAEQGNEALVAIDRAMALQVGDPPAQYFHIKGAILDMLDRRAESIALLQEAVRRRPSANMWHSLGILFDKEHRLQEAADAYKAGLAIDAKHSPNLFHLAHLHAGSDSDKCEKCRSYFVDHPELRNPQRVEELALQMLDAEHGKFASAEIVAGIVARTGVFTTFAARLDELMAQDFSNEALGCLLRARKRLAQK